MEYISDGFIKAVELLVTMNPETYSAIFTTLKVSTLSITTSLLMGIPAGFLLGYLDFPAKKHIKVVFDTLLALPTVVVGLFVYSFISHRGPFGELGLLFTIPGIVVAQTILIIPIVISLTATAIEGLDRRLIMTLHTFGAKERQIIFTSLLEARYAVLTAVIMAYSRAISELGVSQMIGGNIKWNTRTITTTIALETGKGQFAMGIALGLVLLFLAFLVNWVLIILKRRS